jgi:17beta-estradiol 17-dehydrogenase / very-long-chain 3-oxoacyl-CoA reductase
MTDTLFTSLYNSAAAIFIVFITYYVVMPLTKILLTHFVKVKFLSRRSELTSFGSWAVVTGATDGIGKAYCEALAGDGLNIVLISRSVDRLKGTAKEIEEKYSVKTLIISADFTKTDIYSKIGESLQSLDVAVLVNNVGMSYPHPEYFDSNTLEDSMFVDMINCNILSAVSMTRLVLPGMVARGHGGAVINISSYSGVYFVPLLTVYSATKAFVDFFSRAVAYEMFPQGIIVQTVLPLFVATKLSKFRRGSFFIPWPRDYVESALNLLGVENRTFGCLAHSLQAFAVDFMPTVIREWYVMKNMSATRKRALRKSTTKCD